MNLSLAIATHNEEQNIADCIVSCKGLVDEIIVVDGSSTDKTADLARQNGAKVISAQNEHMFHTNKQKAIDACSGDWILQLDADERVTPELAEEIKRIISMTNEEIAEYQSGLKEEELFRRHQKLVQKHVISTEVSMGERSGEILRSLDSFETAQDKFARDDKQHNPTHYPLPAITYNAFFIPRLNFFLGGYLRHGGVYPDGVIRLFKKGKAHLPCKNVHELMEVEGKTGWLASPLIHKDSPTFARYLERNSRYIDHLVEELKHRHSKLATSVMPNSVRHLNRDPDIRRDDTMGDKIHLFVTWVFIKPTVTFFSLLILHKGILDGWRGIVFAFFSAIRFARAYGRYTMKG